ncbi:MAG: hypothetical protein VX278_10505, partial [Myxococcota bacterium]|nr:hypothetical protein [Myxococcota bacterium]
MNAVKTFLPSIFAALLCAANLFCLHATLDLQAWYGPGGVKSITALAEGYPQWDWSTWFMGCLLVLSNDNIPLAARLSPLIGSVITVFSLSVMGEKMFGQGWVVGISAALYAPILWLGILIGGDAIAMGLSYLGLILFYNLWWIAFSLLLFFIAFKIKSIALPTLSYVFATRMRIRFIILTAVLLSPIWINHIRSLRNATSGFFQLWDVLSPSDTIFQLAVTSFVLLLFKRRKRRFPFILWGLTIFAMAYSCWYIGDKIRIRYLIPASLPFLVLTAGLLGTYSRRFFGLRVIVFTLFWGLLLMDGWSFFYTWETKFIENEGVQKSALPTPPKIFLSRYAKMRGLEHSDVSAIGALSLHKLSLRSQKGAAIIPLRDTRHYHLFAGLAVNQYPYREISPEQCCRPQESERECALRVLQSMN